MKEIIKIQNEVKQKIEELVLKDIDYIQNYNPIAKGAESAKYFGKMTIIKPIAANVYPQIYVDMVKRFKKEEAEQRLKNLGLRVTKFFYSAFPDLLKKQQKFSEIFINTAKTHMHEKIEIKGIENIKKLKSCTFKVENCFFCAGITPIENIEIPYCIAKAGIYENLYNIKSLYNENLEPRLVKVDAIKSATFDGDLCEYQLTVID